MGCSFSSMLFWLTSFCFHLSQNKTEKQTKHRAKGWKKEEQNKRRQHEERWRAEEPPGKESACHLVSTRRLPFFWALGRWKGPVGSVPSKCFTFVFCNAGYGTLGLRYNASQMFTKELLSPAFLYKEEGEQAV